MCFVVESLRPTEFYTQKNGNGSRIFGGVGLWYSTPRVFVILVFESVHGSWIVHTHTHNRMQSRERFRVKYIYGSLMGINKMERTLNFKLYSC